MDDEDEGWTTTGCKGIHSHFDSSSGKCVCVQGYQHFGDFVWKPKMMNENSSKNSIGCFYSTSAILTSFTALFLVSLVLFSYSIYLYVLRKRVLNFRNPLKQMPLYFILGAGFCIVFSAMKFYDANRFFIGENPFAIIVYVVFVVTYSLGVLAYHVAFIRIIDGMCGMSSSSYGTINRLLMEHVEKIQVFIYAYLIIIMAIYAVGLHYEDSLILQIQYTMTGVLFLILDFLRLVPIRKLQLEMIQSVKTGSGPIPTMRALRRAVTKLNVILILTLSHIVVLLVFGVTYGVYHHEVHLYVPYYYPLFMVWYYIIAIGCLWSSHNTYVISTHNDINRETRWMKRFSGAIQVTNRFKDRAAHDSYDDHKHNNNNNNKLKSPSKSIDPAVKQDVQEPHKDDYIAQRQLEKSNPIDDRESSTVSKTNYQQQQQQLALQ